MKDVFHDINDKKTLDILVAIWDNIIYHWVGGVNMSQNYKSQSFPLMYNYLGYLQVERGYSSATIYSYFIDLRIFFRYIKATQVGVSLKDCESVDIANLGLDFVQGIKRGDVAAFLSWIALEKGAAEATRNRKIAVLKSFFRYLQELEYLEKNVMTTIKTTKNRKTLPRYLNEFEMENLVNYVTDVNSVRDVAIISLMMVVGLRVGEVSSLNIDGFHNDSMTIVGKGNKERQVYLTTQVKERVEKYLESRPTEGIETNALFLSVRKDRLTVRGIQYMTTKYMNRAGMSQYSCHKLRHTAATQLLKSGANLREIQEILGHESISITEKYTHVESDDLRRVMDRLENSRSNGG